MSYSRDNLDRYIDQRLNRLYDQIMSQRYAYSIPGIPGIKGDKGLTGSRIFLRNGVPQNNLGVNGDLYINSFTDDLYVKNNDFWSLVGNLTGEKGEKGQIGHIGHKGDKGQMGNQGIQGFKGEKGLNGSTILFGQGFPPPYEGENGDVYIDENTGIMYKKINGIWIPQVGLKGSQGEKGENGQKGLKGESGSSAFKGDKGSKGDKGNNGDKGDKGETGMKGESGSAVFKGDKGDKGETGIKGESGASV
ncbi:Collagen triple helix repeat containing protein [Acanthamoeba castellanii mamavirus]|nr:Collagen triple helix repeat containing protein [Acanthamoeba castellanii mamavirus]